MLADHEAGDEPHDIRRPTVWAELEVAAGDEHLRGRRDGRRGGYHDRRKDRGGFRRGLGPGGRAGRGGGGPEEGDGPGGTSPHRWTGIGPRARRKYNTGP